MGSNMDVLSARLTINGADDRRFRLLPGRTFVLEAGDGLRGLLRPFALAVGGHICLVIKVTYNTRAGE